MDFVLISFVGYTSATIVIGLWSTRFSKAETADFFLADRGLGAWVGALSAAASAESGWVTLGLVGMAYHTGIGAVWIVLGTFLAFLFNWFVLAIRLRDRAEVLGAITIPGVLANDYSGTVRELIRWAAVLVIVTMLTAYVAAQLNAAGKTFSAVFNCGYSNGVLIGAALVTAYTISGGFRAVAWSDVAQACVMILTVTVVPLILLSKIGGFSGLYDGLVADHEHALLLDPFNGKTGLALVGFLALWLGIPLGNPGQPHVAIRFMAMKDRQAVLRAGVISSIWVLVLFSGAVLLGITARVYFSDLNDAEQILPLLARDAAVIPGVVGGLILAAIVAAICSTADSQLLVSASAISHDLLEHRVRDRKTVMLINRTAVLIAAAVATSIALGDVRSVFQFVLDYGWAGLGAGFGPALLLNLYFRQATTGWGTLAGIIVGPTTVVLWKQIPGSHQQFYSLLPALFVSVIAILVTSRVEKWLRTSPQPT